MGHSFMRSVVVAALSSEVLDEKRRLDATAMRLLLDETKASPCFLEALAIAAANMT